MLTLLFFSAYPAVVIADLVVLIVLFLLAANEQFVVWLLGLIALFGVYLYLTPVALALVMSNPLWLIVAFVLYFGVGVAYSVYKWWSYVDITELKTHYEHWKNVYPNTNTAGKLSYETEADAKAAFLKSNSNPYRRQGYSLSDDNNWKIANWIVTWPFSLLVDFFRTFFVDLAKNLIRIFSGAYDKITNITVDKL